MRYFEEKRQDLVDLIKGVEILALYFLATYFKALPLIILNVDVEKMSPFWETTYLITFEVLLIGAIIFMLRKDLKAQLLDFKEHKREYFKKYFKLWFVLLIGMAFSNLIILLLNNGAIANNEEEIRDMFKVNPIYIYIAGVLLAPIIEELVFRLSIRKMFKTDIVFIIVSGLLFGSLHVITSAEVLFDYVYIIPYAFTGFIFAYLLVKSKNIFVPMSMHFFHNGVLMALQFLLLLLGQI